MAGFFIDLSSLPRPFTEKQQNKFDNQQKCLEKSLVDAFRRHDMKCIDDILRSKIFDPNHKIGGEPIFLHAIKCLNPCMIQLVSNYGADILDCVEDWKLSLQPPVNPYATLGINPCPLEQETDKEPENIFHIFLDRCGGKLEFYRRKRDQPHKNPVACLQILLDQYLKCTSPQLLIEAIFAKKAGLYKCTPFILACKFGFDEAIIKFLDIIKDCKEEEFKMEWFEREFTNPLHYVYCLSGYYFDPYPENEFTWLSANAISAMLERLPFVEQFINATDSQGYSPLHRALQFQNYKAFCTFLRPWIGPSPEVPDLYESARIECLGSVEAMLRFCCQTDNKKLILKGPMTYNFKQPILESPLSIELGRRPLVFLQIPPNNPDEHMQELETRLKLVELLLAFGLDLTKELYLFTEEERPLDFHSPEFVGISGVSGFDPGHIDPELLEALRQLRLSNQMLSLKRICRNQIRRSLGSNADAAIQQIDCIPESLKMFLFVKNEPAVLKIDFGSTFDK